MEAQASAAGQQRFAMLRTQGETCHARLRSPQKHACAKARQSEQQKQRCQCFKPQSPHLTKDVSQRTRSSGSPTLLAMCCQCLTNCHPR